MRLSLSSDFHDYYDHAFDSGHTDATYHRVSTGGMSRPVMLSHLEINQKLRVPMHGTVSELKVRIENELDYLGSAAVIEDFLANLVDVIVFTDIMAHSGNGKVKLNILEALARYPNHYAIQFIPANPGGLGDSLRYLRIGCRQFWLRYWSMDDWRSNAGDVHIKVLSEEKPKPAASLSKYDEPIIAIDFIKADFLYAIDYNIAPGLARTGIEGFISPTEIYEEVKAWFSQKAIQSASTQLRLVVNG